jgi:hypothetical protein
MPAGEFDEEGSSVQPIRLTPHPVTAVTTLLEENRYEEALALALGIDLAELSDESRADLYIQMALTFFGLERYRDAGEMLWWAEQSDPELVQSDGMAMLLMYAILSQHTEEIPRYFAGLGSRVGVSVDLVEAA